MVDKTQLERDIENRELDRKPLGTLILIALLSISLGVVGVYALKLKQELSTKQQEIILIKQNFNKEKADLLNKIRSLEGEQEFLKSEIKSIRDELNALSQTKTPRKKVKTRHGE